MSDGRTAVATALIGAVATVAVSFITAWATVRTSGGKIADIETSARTSGDKIDSIETRARDLQQQLAGLSVPVGTIVAYAGPIDSKSLEGEGWMVCDGRALNRKEFQPLYDRIATRWGEGDDVLTFNLPDLRGYFLRGVDGGAGVDPDTSRRRTKDGQRTGNAVGSLQSMATALPRAGFTVAPAGRHTHKDPTYNGASGRYELAVGSRGPAGHDYGTQAAPTSPADHHRHTITGGDAETRPANAYVHWLIRVH